MEMETMEAMMEAAPEMQAGQYGEAFWFKMLVRLIDARFPGAGVVIEQLAVLLPWAKLARAITNAIADWREGKDFLVILTEAVKEWLEVEPAPDGPVRFSARA